ncbi:3-phosphoshikimate 1-carboxyvinyltransferase [Bartonella sp. DGB1]|uniref:3-phosphoshikimate 1-carboxyvinyltransferase n=1 Tax=Bartonella sp. DGB1 TaxID=3239807 RepID=UPI00352553E9
MENAMPALISKFTPTINGSLHLLGDKSLSHRAIILSSLATGESIIENLLESDDILNTIKALKNLGAIIYKENFKWHVKGTGNGCLLESTKSLDCGNSGTSLRLLMGLVSSYDITTSFYGDISLSRRPLKQTLIPLKEMGAQIYPIEQTHLPITIKGSFTNAPICYKLPTASAQIKSAILLAALNVAGITTVIEPIKTRDHTEIMLKEFGANIEIKLNENNEREIKIQGQTKLTPQNITIAGDISSAAFLIVAAIIVPKAKLLLKNILINETRIGFIKILQEMGAKITLQNIAIKHGEKIGDIYVENSELTGITVDSSWLPYTIDEYPILAIAASMAKGNSQFLGIQRLQYKESNRIKSLEQGLNICNIKCEATEDSLKIYGIDTKVNNKTPNFYEIDSNNDHRIAMSFLILGLAMNTPIKVTNTGIIKTSFPDFLTLMQKIGANIYEAQT